MTWKEILYTLDYSAERETIISYHRLMAAILDLTLAHHKFW